MMCRLQRRLQIIAMTLGSKVNVKSTGHLILACNTNSLVFLTEVFHIHILYNVCLRCADGQDLGNRVLK